MAKVILDNIIKTKSNFTVFIIKYFYTCIDLIQIKYFSCFQDLSKQISGKMMHANDSTIELSVLTLKTNNIHFLTNSSVDQGFGHKTLTAVDCLLVFFFHLVNN